MGVVEVGAYFSLTLVYFLFQLVSIHLQHSVVLLQDTDVLHSLQLVFLTGQGLCCSLRDREREPSEGESGSAS